MNFKKNELNTLFTVGYSVHTPDSILELLKRHGVNAVADVRSQPYSHYKPDFNKENIELVFKKNEILYVFLGNECGARISASECYVGGKVDYRRIAAHQLFKSGIDRLINGLKKFRIALMCAEKDPITCHRTILICKNLKQYDIDIKHILSDGNLENHQDLELRLLEHFNLSEPELFRSEQDRIDEAYCRQEHIIAFREESDDK